MRKTLFSIMLLFLIIYSCSSDVEIYDDYKDIPVIYGLIDADADTNFIKITRAFCGSNDNPINAFEAATISDSSNYPGKLEAYIAELKSTQNQPFKPTGRKLWLDTITVHDKEEGLFYAPHQKVYYTTEHFNTNEGSDKYHYKLYVVKPNYDTVSSETSIVDGNITIGSSTVSFQSAPSHALSKLIFSSTEEAVLYEIGMQFNYWEGHPGQPMVKKNVTWTHGAKPLGAYEPVEGTDNLFRIYYSVNTLFNYLERAIGNDTLWNESHPNVTRYVDDFIVFIAAAGEDFNNYYQFLQATQNGLNLSSEYSNIEGGFGLFSSRIMVRQKVKLSNSTKYDLFKKPWGFRER